MPFNRVIYHEMQSKFFDDVLTNKVFDKMCSAAEDLDLHPSRAELRSWGNNAPRIKDLLELSGVKDTYVTFEYLVPYNMKRIDCMIYGRDSDDKGQVVHIELKQWSNDSVSPAASAGNFNIDEKGAIDDSDVTYRVDSYTGGRCQIVAHPSQQVKGYQNYLEGFIVVLGDHEIGLNGAAYCYNYYKSKTPVALYDAKYKQLQKEYRTYSADEVEILAGKLKQVLCKGDGFSIFNKMMQSPIRPSKKLLDSAAEMIAKGNENAFSLISDQIVARNEILDKVRALKKQKVKSVILVKGGPGTGKTVIALHILALLAKEHYNIHYATKSKPLLEGIKAQMPRGADCKLLFSNIVQFIPANFDEDSLDVLLVDEAHRITKSPNSQYTPAEKRTDLSQVDVLIRCAKICVFFIDDKQGIRYQEIGSSEMIKEAAQKYGASIEEVQLTSQFRCNGSDNYLDWIEEMLYKDSAQKFIDKHFSSDEYDFRIFDDPQSMYDEIKKKDSQEKTTARLTAGFCWKWSKTLDENGDLCHDVRIGNFSIPWETHENIRNVPAKYARNWYDWAYKPEGINQCGCIYTAQGFEFDYIGVIIGPDLKYDPIQDKVYTDINATEDPTLKRSSKDFDTYVRNIYRVLMSRGMKGCYVYICDNALKEYFVNQLSLARNGYHHEEITHLAADPDVHYGL